VAVVVKSTMLVFTVKVALVRPARTVTEDGTVAAALLLESATTAPPLGAGPLRVTAPVEGFEPVTLVGFRVRDKRTGGSTVREAVWVPPL
jgi:hypothetical protein